MKDASAGCQVFPTGGVPDAGLDYGDFETLLFQDPRWAMDEHSPQTIDYTLVEANNLPDIAVKPGSENPNAPLTPGQQQELEEQQRREEERRQQELQWLRQHGLIE